MGTLPAPPRTCYACGHAGADRMRAFGKNTAGATVTWICTGCDHAPSGTDHVPPTQLDQFRTATAMSRNWYPNHRRNTRALVAEATG